MKFYTVNAVADILGFAPGTIRKLIVDGELEAVLIRSEYRVTDEALDKFVIENTSKVVPKRKKVKTLSDFNDEDVTQTTT